MTRFASGSPGTRRRRVRAFLVENRFLVRLVVSNLVTGALLTTLLLVLVSAVVTDKVLEQAERSTGQVLQQAYTTSYEALTDVYGDFYALWANDPVLAAALSPAGPAPGEEAGIVRLLDATAFRDPLVHSACLVHASADRFLSTLAPPSSLAQAVDPGAVELFRTFRSQYDTAKSEIFFPREAALVYRDRRDTRQYLSIVLAARSDAGDLPAGLVVNIDLGRFADLVDPGSETSRMLIVSGQGTVLADLGGNLAGSADGGASGRLSGRAFPDAGLLAGLADAPARTGSLDRRFEGQASLVTYRRAESLRLLFLSVTPRETLMVPVRQIRGLVALLFCIAIGISLAVGIASSRRIHAPLRALVRSVRNHPASDSGGSQEETAVLGDAIGSLVLQSRQAHLARLLQGRAGKGTLEILGMGHRAFLAVCLVPDRQDAGSLFRIDALASIVQEVVHLPAVSLDGRSLHVVFSADRFDEPGRNWILVQAGEMRRALEAAIGGPVSAGIGSVVEDPFRVRESGRHALEAARKAAARGGDRIGIHETEAEDRPDGKQAQVPVSDQVDALILERLADAGLTLDDLADRVRLSPGYLRQVYRKERGRSVSESILSFRIEAARRLLEETDRPALEIAAQVGFPDSRYFYTVFRKRTGQTTDQYRRSVRSSPGHV